MSDKEKEIPAEEAHESREKRLKRLLFRSGHRGFNEMDQLFKAFAAARLETLTESQLNDYEALLDAADWDVFGWAMGEASPPPELQEIVGILRAFSGTLATKTIAR